MSVYKSKTCINVQRSDRLTANPEEPVIDFFFFLKSKKRWVWLEGQNTGVLPMTTCAVSLKKVNGQCSPAHPKSWPAHNELQIARHDSLQEGAVK